MKKNRFSIFLIMMAVFFGSLSGANLHAAAPPPIANDFSNVVWLHADVSKWAQTATLRPIKVNPTTITLDYDKANVWPGKYIGGALLNANPWIFVYRNNIWYAATWEWMRFGSITKGTYAVNGDHIKKEPLTSFSPVQGELYGFMVSGLARDSSRNVLERSNVVMYYWFDPTPPPPWPTPVTPPVPPVPPVPVSIEGARSLLLLNK